MIKVRGGTRSGDSLCKRCWHAHIIKGAAESEELTYCDEIYPHRILPFQVVECNEFSDKTIPSISSMKEIAWVISSDKAKGKMGFLSPQEWKEVRKKRDSDDDDDLKIPKIPGL